MQFYWANFAARALRLPEPVYVVPGVMLISLPAGLDHVLYLTFTIWVF